MSAGAGGNMYGGGGTFDRMMKGYGGVQNSTGMLNGGPSTNFNGMNIGNKNPYKGGTTEAQMTDNVRRYMHDRAAAKDAAAGVQPGIGSTGSVQDVNGVWHTGDDALNYDPRRSPDVAMPWRVGQGTLPYKGPVTGNVQPPNPSGYYPYGPHASMGSAATPGGYNPMASPSPGGAPMQIGGADIPNWSPTGSYGAAGGAGMAPGGPNMYAGGNPNFNERAPNQWQGLLGRGSY